MIAQVLDDRRIPAFPGDLAIAHCRYSTTGSTIWENAQPTFRLGPRRSVAIGHNGNLVNTRELLGQLEGGRARLAATTDTEVLTTLLSDEPAVDTVDALLQAPAARPRRLHAARARSGSHHRHPRPARLPAARARPDPRCRHGRWRRRSLGGRRDERRLGPLVRDDRPRHRRRGLRPRRRAGRDGHPRAWPRAALGPIRDREPCAVRLRAHLLRAARLVHGGPQPVRGAPPHGRAARAGAPGGRGPGHAGPRHGRTRGGGLRRGLGAAVPRGPRPQPVHRPDVHPAIPDDAPPRRHPEAESRSARSSGAGG